MQLKNLYKECRERLEEQDEIRPDVTARRIIKYAIDINEIDIIMSSEQTVRPEKITEIRQAVDRYIAGEPESRIFGESGFWGLNLNVTNDVLDPRPETEILVEVAIKRFIGDPPSLVLDLGTGSGAILIALLSEWPNAKGLGIDISKKALEVAVENAQINNVHERAKFLQSDWAEKIEGRFDVIVSNPPYVSNQEMANLPKEVFDYDPILALKGGSDGLEHYRKIITEIERLLNPRGRAFFEVGFSLAKDVMRLVEESGLSVVSVYPDMAGIPRVVEISFGEK
jgi:release factor glutamine methyltransferase